MKKFMLILGFFALLNGLLYADNPNEALSKLKEGNARFVTGTQIHPNLDKDRLLNTAKDGQKPFATILACSDSRVPVEAIFDWGVGDLFVIKVAGNVADGDEIGSIEYGTHHLNTPILVVLGHTKCGAVTAVVKGDEVHGHIPALVDNIVPAFESAKEKHSELHQPELIDKTIEANVFQSIKDILSRSSIVAELVKEGKLKIVGAIYDIETGRINWLGNHPEETKFVDAPKEDPHSKHESHESFFTSSNFIFMGIFILVVSLLATVLIVMKTRKK